MSTGPSIDRVIDFRDIESLFTVFTRNDGQWEDERLYFTTRSGPCRVMFRDSEVEIAVDSPLGSTQPMDRLIMAFHGSHYVIPRGLGRSTNRASFFFGDNTSDWIHDVPSYRCIIYEDIYTDIDLKFYFSNGHLKWDWVVSPHTSTDIIGMHFMGSDSVSINGIGDLIVDTRSGGFEIGKPICYQDSSQGREEVRASYIIDDGLIRYRLDPFDHSMALIIDPFFRSTFLGGSYPEIGYEVEMAPDGDLVIAGYTESGDFPITSGSFDETINGDTDIFVLKIKPDCSELSFGTFIGGSAYDRCDSLAVDESGYMYLTGETASTDFPVTPGVYDNTNNGGDDTYIIKLSPRGNSLAFSTFIGGSGDDMGRVLAVDSVGNIYLTGYTDSTDFPITSGAFDTSITGLFDDGFVLKMDSNGTSLVYSSYMGGSHDDEGWHITVDDMGQAYISGYSQSTDFPTTADAYDTSLSNSSTDGIIVKLASNGSLLYSSYLGGPMAENAKHINLNSKGEVIVIGYTGSSDFPTTTDALYPALLGAKDAFVTIWSSNMSQLKYSTFLGGSQDEEPTQSTVDLDDDIYVTGWTYSTDFNTTRDCFSDTLKGRYDGFLVKISEDGSILLYSTLFGGGNNDIGGDVVVSRDNDVYLTGLTRSTDFPTSTGCFDSTHNGFNDAFLLMLPEEFITLADSDNDGVLDVNDAFPLNPFEYIDTDGDGLGDNLDPDADDDGIPDNIDVFPLNATEAYDTDMDGVGDNGDPDDDNDGVPDTMDAFPKNPNEYSDLDGDGIGDNLDEDDDDDGIPDDVELLAQVKERLDNITRSLDLITSILSNDLGELNRSLHSTLSDLENSFLAELRQVNSSLANDIQTSFDGINLGIMGLNLSITGDINALEKWLDEVLRALDSSLQGANASLHSNLDDMENRNIQFLNGLRDDIISIHIQLVEMEGNLSNGSLMIRDDLVTLSELTTNLNEHTLSELSSLLDSLASDIEGLDAGLSEKLRGIASNITSFRADMGAELGDINQTLQDLEKLDTLINDLSDLDSDLGLAKKELDSSIDETGDKTQRSSMVIMGLVIVVLVLLTIILLLVVRLRREASDHDSDKNPTLKDV